MALDIYDTVEVLSNGRHPGGYGRCMVGMLPVIILRVILSLFPRVYFLLGNTYCQFTTVLASTKAQSWWQRTSEDQHEVTAVGHVA